MDMLVADLQYQVRRLSAEVNVLRASYFGVRAAHRAEYLRAQRYRRLVYWKEAHGFKVRVESIRRNALRGIRLVIRWPGGRYFTVGVLLVPWLPLVCYWPREGALMEILLVRNTAWLKKRIRI